MTSLPSPPVNDLAWLKEKEGGEREGGGGVGEEGKKGRRKGKERG